MDVITAQILLYLNNEHVRLHEEKERASSQQYLSDIVNQIKSIEGVMPEVARVTTEEKQDTNKEPESEEE